MDYEHRIKRYMDIMLHGKWIIRCKRQKCFMTLEWSTRLDIRLDHRCVLGWRISVCFCYVISMRVAYLLVFRGTRFIELIPLFFSYTMSMLFASPVFSEITSAPFSLPYFFCYKMLVHFAYPLISRFLCFYVKLLVFLTRFIPLRALGTHASPKACALHSP